MPPEAPLTPYPSGVRNVALPIGRAIAWVLLTLLGPVRVSGRSRVPRSGGLLVLANHLSDVDPIVVQYACPRPIRFMAKSDLFSIPVIGALMRYFQAFPVKRGEPDRGALKFSATVLKSGEAVGVFPEGQLSESGKLLEMKAGVALIVRMANVPVICLGLTGTQRIMPYAKVVPRPAFHRVDARWGQARSFTKESTPEEILGWIESELRSLTDPPA